jgi:hypothetical protein
MNKTNTTKINNILVNIHSEKLSKITGKNPLQIRIYSDFNNKSQTITNIKSGVKQLYPDTQINEIFTNNNINFVNVQQDINKNITGFAIFI